LSEGDDAAPDAWAGVAAGTLDGAAVAAEAGERSAPPLPLFVSCLPFSF
jgi:hypothetical protein